MLLALKIPGLMRVGLTVLLRAISTLKATYTAINTLLLKEVLADYHQELLKDRTGLYTLLMKIRDALKSDNVQFLKSIWNNFSRKLESPNICNTLRSVASAL